MSKKMQSGAAFAIAALIVLTAFALFGWWAFSFSTHTLVWLSFMGFSIGSAGTKFKR